MSLGMKREAAQEQYDDLIFCNMQRLPLRQALFDGWQAKSLSVNSKGDHFDANTGVRFPAVACTQVVSERTRYCANDLHRCLGCTHERIVCFKGGSQKAADRVHRRRTADRVRESAKREGSGPGVLPRPGVTGI
jgi:hypothetical protein